VAAMANEGPIPDAPDDRILLALGFTFAHSQVDTAIVGTTNPDHLDENMKATLAGPLSEDVVNEARSRLGLGAGPA